MREAIYEYVLPKKKPIPEGIGVPTLDPIPGSSE